jgi:hypothetical protein
MDLAFVARQDFSSMKTPINPHKFIDLDAPTLGAEPVQTKGGKRWRVWCKHRNAWHIHGPGDGHREARYFDSSSPYWKTGYNLAEKTV